MQRVAWMRLNQQKTLCDSWSLLSCWNGISYEEPFGLFGGVGAIRPDGMRK